MCSCKHFDDIIVGKYFVIVEKIKMASFNYTTKSRFLISVNNVIILTDVVQFFSI